MITSLNHITIAVRDLEGSFSFYQDVLGFKPILRWKGGAYFLAGDLWFCLDLDSSTRKEALPEYTHIAFTISQSDFPKMVTRIRESGAKAWKENISEGDSFYFLDPNGHKLEIHVGDWRSRLQSALENPWDVSVEIL
ncbi:MAG: VOC family protein [Bdellovibrionaceae bacterium]|nr:VOC family protein [Bdellovibrionales bacterium]MCB9084298.1 VOC family protein [Pseudobdellovibrionaceae bacterium]